MDTSMTFTVNGRSYQIAVVDELSFGEQRAIKRISGGITARDLDDALHAMDPDAWFALLLVSMRRDRPETTEEELEATDFVDVMMPIAEQLLEPATGTGDAGPPPMAGEANEPPATPAETPEGAGVL
jgi:hypothetical protein